MDQQIYISKENFSLSNFERFVIVADVGGNHTYIAILAIKDKKNYEIVFKNTLFTADIKELYLLLNDALRQAHYEYGIEIGRAVIAAAGPVSRKRGYIRLTNVNLTISSKDILEHTLLKKVILLNDFEAIGYGLDLLDMKNDVILLPHIGVDLTSPSLLSNTFAVIGAGNGLGMTVAYYDLIRHMHVPLPSEGGHIEFSPHSLFELELIKYTKENILTKKDAHPEFERFVSGNGISIIYDFLRYKNIFVETDVTRRTDKLQGNEKLNSIDINQDDPTCKKTIDIFLSFYARAAKNLALLSECYSGLFITGGIVLHHLSRFQEAIFMKEFELHDIRSDVLRKTPVYIVKNKDIGLFGCCNVAVNFYNLM